MSAAVDMQACIPPPPMPPPPPPPLGMTPHERLPQQMTPQPRSQLKHLPWKKIPATRVVTSTNLWTEVGKGRTDDGCVVDFDQIEELFAVNRRPNRTGEDEIDGSCHSCNGGDSDVPDRASWRLSTDGRKRPSEVNLLDSKRSMNVNIFLHQFQGVSHSEIVGYLEAADSRRFGADRLRFLHKSLPDDDEVDRLMRYDGSREYLGQAEKFYLELMSVPNYRSIVYVLLVQEEFHQTMDRITPVLDAVIISAKDIKKSKALHELIYNVLVIGNFMNAGYYGGDAAGFQLSSLLNLTEIRANKPGMNLMHYVAQKVADKNPTLIAELRELKHLHEAASYPIDALGSEIRQLVEQFNAANELVADTQPQFQKRMEPFFTRASQELKRATAKVDQIEDLRVELAEFFCEESATFSLDECMSTFNGFSQKFLSAVEENRQRELQQGRRHQRNRSEPVRLDDGPAGQLRVPELRTPSCSDAGSEGDELATCLLRNSEFRRSVTARRSHSRPLSSSSRLSVETLLDRERSPSPRLSPTFVSPTVMPGSSEGDFLRIQSVDGGGDDEDDKGVDGVDRKVQLLRRGSSGRSSCPSRVNSSKRKAGEAPWKTSSSSAAAAAAAAAASEAQVTAPVVCNGRAQSPESRAVVVQSPPAVDSRSLKDKRSAAYDLSGSSINLLGPCAALLLSSSLTASSDGDKSRSGSGVDDAETRAEPEVDLSTGDPLRGSFRRRTLSKNREWFKQLSDTYNAGMDDYASGNRRSLTSGVERSQSNDVGLSTVSVEVEVPRSTTSTVDTKDVVRRNHPASTAPPSVGSVNDDEGFESDFSSSVRSSMISQSSDLDYLASASATPAAVQPIDVVRPEARGRPASKTTAAMATSKKSTTSSSNDHTAKTQQAVPVWMRLTAATVSSARRALKPVVASSAAPSKGAVVSHTAGKSSAQARSRSTPPTSKLSAAPSATPHTEQQPRRTTAPASTTHFQRTTSIPHKADELVRVGSFRSPAASSSGARQTTGGRTSLGSTAFSRNAPARSTMPAGQLRFSTVPADGKSRGTPRTSSSEDILDGEQRHTRATVQRRPTTHRVVPKGSSQLVAVDGVGAAHPTRPARPGIDANGGSRGHPTATTTTTTPRRPSHPATSKTVSAGARPTARGSSTDRKHVTAFEDTKHEIFV